MKKLILTYVCLFLVLTPLIYTQVSILGPPVLAGKMKNYETPSQGIDYNLGNFGEIPYGKTLVGYVFYNKHQDGSNDWCDFEKTSSPANIDKDPDNDYSPIFLVDQYFLFNNSTDECSMLRKAYNVRARGGRAMLLISDDRTFKDRKNVDDQLGNRVDIPTIILKKDEGEEIKNYISLNKHEKVVMSIKFIGMRNSDVLNIELYMRSDNMKSIHFFKEFKQYYNKLSKTF